MEHSILLDSVAKNALDLLKNEGQNIVQGRSLTSPRAIGDAVQAFLGEKLNQCFPENTLKNFESDFERRSMEDMAFYDADNHYYAVDCKTHNLTTTFNMPNLISVKRLANFYRNDNNFFCILIVEYQVTDEHIAYNNCYFKPIEAFPWDCLTIGALGWGQIQIANANILKFNDSVNRKDWMLQLCDTLSLFYDEEISKIGERKLWFEDIRKYWETK